MTAAWHRLSPGDFVLQLPCASLPTEVAYSDVQSLEEVRKKGPLGGIDRPGPGCLEQEGVCEDPDAAAHDQLE